jgi:hypothetical protein
MQTAIQTQFGKDKFAYMLRVIAHPADAFYEIRHHEQGSAALALICVAVFATCYTMNRIFASFIVNDVDPMSVDGLLELSSVLLLVLLFAVGNWSVTCLLNGEGRFRDILTVTGYSLLPLILCYIIATIVSRFVASGEEVFYSIIITIGTAWTAILLLLGVMTVHNYTMVKTLGTLLLTVLAMFIMIFLALLLADMINQVFGFFYGIYIELIFRS